MSLDIKFSSPYSGFIEHPKPSLSHIPLEYKKMENHIDNKIKQRTVKKCIPFLDSLTCGYIIPFPMDLHFSYDKEKKQALFELPDIPSYFNNSFEVEFHGDFQISNELKHIHRTIEGVFKFQNPWTVTTPPGYSCIFTQPFNRNLPFKIIDGIVDTDKFPFSVNFPFYWTNSIDIPFTLKAGSPMALVIPFKRDSWKMKVEVGKNPELDHLKELNFFSKIIDNYKNKSWSKKQFK
tara:strand:+ start:1181 stop:1885 length:705 start_codon:yes stop_codon:yes gene_type:complete